MAKNKKHIDDLFKDNLQGAQLPLDGSEWNKLFNAIQPKKKRFLLWWWLGTVGLIILAVSFFYLISSNNTKDHEALVKANAETMQFPAIDADVSSTTESIVNETNTKADDQSTMRSENANELVKASPSIESQSTNPTNKSRIAKKVVADNKDITTDVLPQGTAKPDLIYLAMKQAISLNWKNNMHENALQSTIAENKQPLIWIYAMENLIDTFPPINKILAPYAGFNFGATGFSQNLRSSIPNYTTYRKSNEASSFLPNLGFDLGGEFKGLQVASGIKYLEKGQKSNPRFTYEKYDSIRRVDSNGDTTYPRWNYRDTTINGVPRPKYRYASLPVSIGKTVYSGDKWDLTLGVNTNIQFLVSATGTILNDELSPSNVQRLTGFNRLSLTYGGYFAVGYAINDRWKLKVHTRVDADALDMLKHSDVSQKMNGFGTDISFQFKLKK